jgi:cell wall-associated NlpC family hydrolase
MLLLLFLLVRRSTPPQRAFVTAVAVALMTLGPVGPAQAAPGPGSLADARAEAGRVRATVDRMQRKIQALTVDFDANQAAIDQAIAADLAGRRHLEEADAAVAEAQARMDERARAAYQRGPVAGIESFLHARDWHEMVAVSASVDAAAQADRAAVATLAAARTREAATGERLAADRLERQRLDGELAAQRARIEQRVATLTSYLAQVDERVATLLEQERRRQEAARQAAIARQLAAERAAASISTEGWQMGGTPGASGATEAQAQRAVSWAMAQLGKPYRWGATGPDTFDCSGLVLRAWQAAGVNLPRVSRAQYTVGVPVRRLADLRPGDLVFYGDSPATIHHVGMYVGDGSMVEAPYTGASVRIASIGRPDLVGAIRPGP